MKHASHVEIEMKFRIPALEPARLRLEAAGFTPAHPQSEERSVLWDRGGDLLGRGCALRLRRYDGLALLTWKGPRLADPLLKIRPELETTLADPLAMEGILEALGFAPVFTMVKSRSVWRLGALEACLDQAPFGCYLELEGAPEEATVWRSLKELGQYQADGRLPKVQAVAARRTLEKVDRPSLLFAGFVRLFADGSLLEGVKRLGNTMTTESVVMRASSGTVRWVTAPSTSRVTSPSTFASVRKCCGRTTRIIAVSAPQPTAPPEDRARWATSCLRRQARHTLAHPWFRNIPRRNRVDRWPSRRAAR